MDMHGSAAAAEGHESGGGSSEVGGSSGGGGGNRWPRDETLALLKIRSDMDVAFRDSIAKGPLWDEVSRKMRELGYQRSAKKCKEKFENVYKYHKRTKDGRTSKPDGGGAKTYRFFDQLEALQNTPPPLHCPPQPSPIAATPPPIMPSNTTSYQPTPPNTNPSVVFQQSQPPSQLPSPIPPSTTSSSSTSSDEDIQRRQRSKKRKWRDFFQRLLDDVIHKQEELQQKFLQTLERRERDRLVREEAWRAEEMARINREHEVLVQERSIAAAKDTAVINFLQKVSQQHNLQIPIGNISPRTVPQVSAATMRVKVREIPPPPSQPPQQQPKEATKVDNISVDNLTPGSSSRWPKTEIEALIKIRTDLDVKYQDSGPKGPLWQEISATMAKLGYSRSAKRCKEKWENINKYFKKVKESNKKRPEDSKTCPYFHQLDAIYKEKAKNDVVIRGFSQGYAADNSMAAPPIMARPEQQWPLPDHHLQGSATGINHDPDNESDDYDDDEEDGEDYEVVANKQP